MQTVNLIQNSPEWHAHRANHFNASDAPAMMGVSKYKTRDQLLHEIATGLTKEVDANTQKLFDDGHKFEALARPLAEKIIGDELSPTVGVEGKYSASFDGITFDGSVIFEHKTLNAEIAACFDNGGEGEDLPLMYRVQMEQQLMISGAEKCLFMASKWYDNELDEELHCYYYTDANLRAQITAGWEQFEKDLANYVPPVQVEKVVAETVESLPVPSVVVRGEITASNLAEITPKFDAYLESVSTELKTDQDFANAEAEAKNCRETAKRIEALQDNIIAQMVSVNELNSTLNNYKEAFNKLGLRLEKAVKEQKESIKTNAILQAKQAFTDHVVECEKGLPFGLQMPMQQMGMYPNFAEVIKGVKTIQSMQSRLNDAVANGKAQATQLANDVKSKLAYIEEAGKGYEHLIVKHDLAFKDIEFIKLSIQSTIDKENARRAEREAEIKAQAERDARAKIEAQKVNEAKPQVVESEAVTLSSQDQVSETASSLTLFNTQFRQVFQPSADEIVNAVAKAWNVDKGTAHKWLVETDFAMLMVA